MIHSQTNVNLIILMMTFVVEVYYSVNKAKGFNIKAFSITISVARNNIKSFRYWLLLFVLDSDFNKDKSSSAGE